MNDTQRQHSAATPAKKRSGSTPEAKVLKACSDYLELLGFYVSRTGAGLVTVEGML